MSFARSAALVAAFAVAVIAIPQVAPAQGGGGSDRVYYRDRAKDGQISVATGETKESAGGIQVFAGGKVLKSISAADLLRVEYSKLPGLDDADRLSANSDESKEARDAKDISRVRTEYAARSKKAGPGADPKTRRFLDFREAMWAVRQADGRTGPDFKVDAAAAVKQLTSFVQLNGKTWEAWPASHAAARLNAEMSLPDEGKPANGAAFNAAAANLAVLAKNADLPADLRADAKVSEAEMLMRTGAKIAVEPIAQALGSDKDIPATGPTRDRLTVLQGVLKAATAADAVKVVEAMVAKSADAGVRAAARNALGEFYLMNAKPREAMWEFLWAATVFTQDRDQTLYAHIRLVAVFEQLGDKTRADDFREKLLRLKAG